ncbi:hypothetical protein [Lactobacillus intestinalis]|uniref:hypothetical protein n=1 Tax=Lactobacillus intestinalis TaxID=151781 RepID=UPI0002CBB676|nr:hypothetical protein [Lactobacillus intestinalis]KAI4308888.1 hypothetical protein C821_000559 [Lactobacillus intestinalis]
MESKNTGLSIEDKIQIALMVKAMMKEEKKKPKFPRDWIVLRKEIEEYCRYENEKGKFAFSTLQAKIYDAIRVCLDISRFDEMTESQVRKAREVFNFIKQERDIGD